MLCPGLPRERSRKVRPRRCPSTSRGGLGPENVVEAVARVRPAGVDVNPGVEDANRRKDTAKMRAFVDRAGAELQQARGAP